MVTITFQPGVKIKEMRTKYTCISDDNPAKNKVQRQFWSRGFNAKSMSPRSSKNNEF